MRSRDVCMCACVYERRRRGGGGNVKAESENRKRGRIRKGGKGDDREWKGRKGKQIAPIKKVKVAHTRLPSVGFRS